MDSLNRIPQKWFSSMRKQITQSTSVDELVKIMSSIKVNIGADYYSLGTYFEHSDKDKNNLFVASDTPQEWREKYKVENFINSDIRLIKAKQSSLPFTWENLEYDKNSGKVDVLQEASKYDINHGVTFPIHGPQGSYFGFLFLAYKIKPKKMQSRIEHITPYMQIIVMQLIETLRKRIQSESYYFSEHHSSSLTKRQRTCLAWAAEGKTSEEIGIILQISSSMVNRHLDNASHKLNSTNRAQCIAKAIDQKLIALEHKKRQVVSYLHK